MSDLGLIKTPACSCSDEEGDDAACPVHQRCACGEVIDLSCCECGTGARNHDPFEEGHAFVPMGCRCHLLAGIDPGHDARRNGGDNDDDDERDCF